MGFTVFVSSPLGTDITTGEIVDGAVTAAKQAASTKGGFWTIKPDGTWTVGAGTWAQIDDPDGTAFKSQTAFTNSAAAAHADNITKAVSLPGGTYTIQVPVTKIANGGILELLEGASSLGTIDTYAAGTSFSVEELTGVTITGGAFTLKVAVNGKHASSSDYRIRVGDIVFIRTGD